MVTVLKHKEIVKNAKGVDVYVSISGTVDNRPARATSENFSITDEEAKTLLENSIGGA